MLKKYFKKALIIFILLIVVSTNFYFSFDCQAGVSDDIKTSMGNAANLSWGKTDPTGSNSLGGIVATAVKAFLGLLGIIFLVLIIYAGFNWMTAQGEEEKVTKAKETLQSAVIGLIIIIAAYSITYFVFNNLPGGSSGGGADVTVH